MEVKDTLCSVAIPDVAAVDIIASFSSKYPHLQPSPEEEAAAKSSNISGPSFPKFSMATGDFVEVYGKDPASAGQWDCVVTCFFIDTAPVVIE